MTNLNNVLAAIGDPTRRAIVARLSKGPARISDVALEFPMSLTGVCKHVRILERSGLVRRTREGRENTLALSAAPLREVARWLLEYQPFGETRMDRLERFFADKKEREKKR
jgi:DNA-binding transcriptional ArsR family regulator